MPTQGFLVRDIIGRDTTANRPGPTTVPKGSLYINTTTNYIQQTDGAAWIDIISTTAGGQATIQFQDEGSNLGATGTVDTVNFVGAGVTATRATNTITATISGSATPGGSSTQVQYNNAGALGGITGATSNGTNLTVKDANLEIVDDGDTTKIVKVQASGLTTATTRTLTIPDASGTVVLDTATQTLTNKTLTSPTINTPIVTVNDTQWTMQDDGDTTKKLQFQLSGITTGTTRTLTAPDANDTLVGKATTDTLTNKSLTGTTNIVDINDNNFLVHDNSDTTKKIQFEVSTVTTATTRSYSSPDANGTLVLDTATQTLTNKTLTLPTLTVNDNAFTIQDNLDTTKKVTFQLSSLTTAITHVYNFPDSDSTLVGDGAPQTLTSKSFLDNSNIFNVSDNQFTWHDDGDGTKKLQYQLSGLTTATTRTWTIGDFSGVPVIDTAAQTLTNKRVTKRVVTVSDATSFTPNGDTTDIMYQSNTQGAGTLTANAPTGTPTDGQQLQIRVKCTNAQTWSWNAIYRGSTDQALPTTATAAKMDYVGFQYNSIDSKWDCLAVNKGF